jgi:AraC-like DNA-binding protein
MPDPVHFPEAWVKTPIKSTIGTIWMAGTLDDNRRIPRDRMRVLGRSAVVLVLGGRGYYADANGIDATLRPGDAIAVCPDLPHAYGAEAGTRWRQAFVVFSGPQFDLLQESETYTAHHPLWHLEPVDLWRRRLEEILAPSPSRTPLAALRIVGSLAQLLIEMATTDAAARENPMDDWLEEGIRLLGEPDKQQGWRTPQEVARQLGQSYETFRKRFTSLTGKPPRQFQKQRKIDLACSAIYQGGDNFKDLAETLGFCDVYHFSKTFRAVVGTPPAEYRRSVRGG